MALPESVAIKFGLYTLACRELLNRLLELLAATQNDRRLDYEMCLQRFDESLHFFFKRSSAKDLVQAAEHFGGLLNAQANLFNDSNEYAAAVFGDVVAAIKNQAASWHFQTDLERLHTQGRALAHRFFENSPWLEMQERFGCNCHLCVDYGEPSNEDRAARLAEPFGYRVPPLVYSADYSYYAGEQAHSNVVVARFTFDHDFTIYLAYPFLFLHEYTAHIYANDHGNECFNDGWMLHAAAAFLKREWNQMLEQCELNWEQAGVFYERLYAKINPIPREACRFARELDDLLWDCSLPTASLSERFKQYTYELAAFQPRGGETVHWPTQFIYALQQEFRTDRVRLLSKIRTSSSARELMTILPHA